MGREQWRGAVGSGGSEWSTTVPCEEGNLHKGQCDKGETERQLPRRSGPVITRSNPQAAKAAVSQDPKSLSKLRAEEPQNMEKAGDYG